MSISQQIITISLVVLATCITRFLPFVLFKDEKKTPVFIQQLSDTLPYACMGLLVIYCLKDVSFLNFPYGLCEIISILCIIFIHIRKRNVLLSITLGTIIYMVLLQIL